MNALLTVIFVAFFISTGLFLNHLKKTKESKETNKKSVETKETLKPGMRFKMENDNPFSSSVECTVVEVKGGYVQYQYKDSSGYDSLKISTFLWIYKRIE